MLQWPVCRSKSAFDIPVASRRVYPGGSRRQSAGINPAARRSRYHSLENALADIAGVVDRAVDAIRLLALDGIAVIQQPIEGQSIGRLQQVQHGQYGVIG